MAAFNAALNDLDVLSEQPLHDAQAEKRLRRFITKEAPLHYLPASDVILQLNELHNGLKKAMGAGAGSSNSTSTSSSSASTSRSGSESS